MATKQGDLSLLKDPVAQKLLQSTIPARLAYVWTDGTPRVVPIWFHWTRDQFVLATPPKAPKLKALVNNSKVALTIDDNTWPHKVLMVRGTATVQMTSSIPDEYIAAARRYFGDEQGGAWINQLRGMVPGMARISVRPEWVGLIDFETRFPSALST
jgi:hypothetical protein